MTDLLLPPVAPARQVHSPLDWRPEWGPAPRWATPRCPDRPTYGGEVARLALGMRLPLMPWQAYIQDVINEVDPVTGWWAYDEAVITVPRQAGKTTLKIPLYAHRMRNTRRGEFWMTAQNGQKAVKRWSVASQSMLDIPELNPLLKQWVSNSNWKLLWKDTGSILIPFAPNDENMHGESPEIRSAGSGRARGVVSARIPDEERAGDQDVDDGHGGVRRAQPGRENGAGSGRN